MPACSFPIQRLPDEILSHLFEVGSWFRDRDVEEPTSSGSHKSKSSQRPGVLATRRHQKQFLKSVSEVCLRWREISRWKGSAHRWYMTVSLNFDGMESRQSDISRELHSFHTALKASSGCDLEVELLYTTGIDPNLEDRFEVDNVDDHVYGTLCLFMHGMRMLYQNLEQVTVLVAKLSQPDVVYMLFKMLKGWCSPSRLTWLDVSYGGDLTIQSLALVPQMRGLQYFPNYIQSDNIPSLPQTLVDIKFDNLSFPSILKFPRGLTHLALKRIDQGAWPDLQPWIPQLDCLSHVELDVHGTKPPDFPLEANALQVLRLTAESAGFPTCLQIFKAENLHTLYLAINESEQRNGRQALSSSLAPGRPSLAPVELYLKCSPNFLTAVHRSLAVHRLERLSMKISLSAVPGAVETSINLGDTLPSQPIVLPKLRALEIENYCAYRSQIFEHLSIPYLEKSWFTYSDWPYYAHEEDGAFEEWICFSSHHGCKSLSRLTSLEMSLLKFDAAAMCHPYVYVPSIEELTVCIYNRDQISGLQWFIYPAPAPLPDTCLPPLSHLRHFTIKMLISSTPDLEHALERKIHDIQASRTEREVGLKMALIEWKGNTVEFLPNQHTGCLEKIERIKPNKH